MRKLYGFIFGVMALCLLAACSSTALYSDPKTEELFRMIPSAALRDHKIKTIVYDYEMVGDADFVGLRISMKEDQKLNLRYTGKDGRVTEFRLNGEEAVAYEPAAKKFEAVDPEVVLALRFFYDMNFIGPEYLAQRISLVSRVPQKLDGKGPLCYEFEITPKTDYRVKNIRVFSDVKRHIILRILYDRSRSQDDKGEEAEVSNSFRDVMIRDGIAVPVLVESNFLGNKYTLKLKSFRSNMPVSDSLFELTKKEPVKPESAGAAAEQPAVEKQGEKAAAEQPAVEKQGKKAAAEQPAAAADEKSKTSDKVEK